MKEIFERVSIYYRQKCKNDKISVYLRSLETIADKNEGQRSRRAKELLTKYRMSDRPDRKTARKYDKRKIGNPSFNINKIENSTVDVQGNISKIINNASDQNDRPAKKKKPSYVEPKSEEEEFEEGLTMFFKSSELSQMQELVSEAIKNSNDNFNIYFYLSDYTSLSNTDLKV
ncbi:hypothetical protein F8M41_000893 [Gigaspora margarita]|uniref:Uncharacterized protein n=1 Tax=Gigaspora margarita TaxID=4874 RepID=A0A8H4A8I8_GIGMA|nr:hypothetical protein F8M41_000893 [Gigaspora margarita]